MLTFVFLFSFTKMLLIAVNIVKFLANFSLCIFIFQFPIHFNSFKST